MRPMLLLKLRHSRELAEHGVPHRGTPRSMQVPAMIHVSTPQQGTNTRAPDRNAQRQHLFHRINSELSELRRRLEHESRGSLVDFYCLNPYLLAPEIVLIEQPANGVLGHAHEQTLNTGIPGLQTAPSAVGEQPHGEQAGSQQVNVRPCALHKL